MVLIINYDVDYGMFGSQNSGFIIKDIACSVQNDIFYLLHVMSKLGE